MQSRLRRDTPVSGRRRQRRAVEGGDGVPRRRSSERLPAARQRRRAEHRRQQDDDQLFGSAAQIRRSVPPAAENVAITSLRSFTETLNKLLGATVECWTRLILGRYCCVTTMGKLFTPL